MSSWITLDMNDVPLFKQIESVLEQTLIPLDVIIQILKVTGTVLKTLMKILQLIAAADPTAAIIAIIKSLIDSLAGGKVHLLIIKPIDKVNPSQYVIQKVSNSLSDYSDINRPKFELGDVSCGFVMYASAPDLSELENIIKGFQQLVQCGFKDITDYFGAIKNFTYPDNFLHTTGSVTGFPDGGDVKLEFLDSTKRKDNYVDMLSGGIIEFNTGKNAMKQARLASYDWRTGSFVLSEALLYDLQIGDFYSIYASAIEEPPDWQSMSLSNAVPIFGELIEFLNTMVKVLEGPVSLAKMASVLANNILNKIQLLEGIAQKVAELKEKLLNFYKLNNINILPIPPQALGNVGYASTLEFSDGKPEQGQTQYVVGAAICGGETIYPVLQLIMGLG